MGKKILDGLKSFEYEHIWDSEALGKLKGTTGLETIVTGVNKHGIEKLIKAEYTGSALKVNKSNFPEVHQRLVETCNILAVYPIPSLYIQWDYAINACAMGVENTFIVLNSGILDLLTEDEINFIIGHEVGHIKSQHILYHEIAGIFPFIGEIIGYATLGIGSLVASGLQLALMKWKRMSEFTADRAGLLACQDFNAACSAFIKMSGLPSKYYDRIDVNMFLEQAKEFESYDISMVDSLAKKFINLQQDHPWSVLRAAELKKWCEDGSYWKVLNREDRDNLTSKCPYCHSLIKKGDIFCTNCGYKLNYLKK